MRGLRFAGVFLSMCVLVLCSSASAYAQEASVIGSVVDQTKAVLPGATITATALDTGVQTVAVSDARAEYRLRLAPGTYKLQGLPLHKVDVKVTKDIVVVRTMKVSLIGEVFNLFNHANYGSYATSLSATNAATTALFGQPQQSAGNAYVPREAQLGFRIGF